jgi:DNA primase
MIPKILNPSSYEAPPPNRFLYNFDKAVFFPNLVLTEGVFDCLTVDRIGFEACAVATFGKKLSNAQLELIIEEGSFKKIIFAWDTRDAIPEIYKHANYLSNFYDVYVASFPGEEDPNSLGRDLAQHYIKRAEPFDKIKMRLYAHVKGILNKGEINFDQLTIA